MCYQGEASVIRTQSHVSCIQDTAARTKVRAGSSSSQLYRVLAQECDYLPVGSVPWLQPKSEAVIDPVELESWA